MINRNIFSIVTIDGVNNDYIPQWHDYIEKFSNDFLNDEFVIVETSKDYTKFINLVNMFKYCKNITVKHFPGCYDSDAHINLYKKNKNNDDINRFIFLQDSFIPKTLNMLKSFIKSDFDVIPLYTHPFFFDNSEQENFCRKILGYDKPYAQSCISKKLIFGPIFSITKKSLDKIQNLIYNIKVECKNNQMAMERGWSMIFNKYGISIGESIKCLQLNNKIDNYYLTDNDFIKYFPKREIN